MDNKPTTPPANSQEVWLNAAYEMLTQNGVEAVKVMSLAKSLNLTRTGFYWHFKGRDDLLEAMISRWENKNTGNLVARCEAYSDNICEAVFNLFDCWIDDTLFDAKLDIAIRNWARNDPKLQTRLNLADARRKAAICKIFSRHGYTNQQAEARALTILYTQIGYISMQVCENSDGRVSRMPDYIEVYTGIAPQDSDILRFKTRHGLLPPNSDAAE